MVRLVKRLTDRLMQNRQLAGKLALFLAALIWGSSFVVVKNTVDTISTEFLLGFRFPLAALLLALVFHKSLLRFDAVYLRQGLILGVLLFAAYYTQTIGITDTTPGKNAFLTAVYCAVVPFLYWAVDRLRPDVYNIAAALMCIGGIGLVSLTADFRIGIGDGMTLVGAFFYAAHIVALAKFTRGRDAMLLTMIQFAACGVLAWLCFALLRPGVPELTSANISALLYLTVFCSAMTLSLQSFGQKYTDPASASILLSLESVLGVVFSVVFYNEPITLRLLLGFAVIFAAVMVSETKLGFIRGRGAGDKKTGGKKSLDKAVDLG